MLSGEVCENEPVVQPVGCVRRREAHWRGRERCLFGPKCSLCRIGCQMVHGRAHGEAAFGERRAREIV